MRRLLVEESTPAGFGCFILVVAYGPGGAIQRQANDLGGGKTDPMVGMASFVAFPFRVRPSAACLTGPEMSRLGD